VKSICRHWSNLLLVLAVIIVVNTPNIALAAEEEEKDTYAGVDLNVMALNALGKTYTPLNLRAKLGLVMFPDLIPVLSFESHFGFNLTDSVNNVDGQDVTLWVHNYVGAYARASFELQDAINLYGLLGAAVIQLKGDTGPLKKDTESGISLGFGANFGLPFGMDGNVEIMQLVNGSSYDIYMLSIGVSYKL